VRQVYVLSHAQARQNAVKAVSGAPDGWMVEVKEKTRSLEQNAKLWASLTDLSRQVVWHGQKLTPENWKDVMTSSLKRQAVVPGIDGGFVVLGQSTSKMTKGEMVELIELILAFGAQQGVKFGDDYEMP
jgi:hypothetical protein